MGVPHIVIVGGGFAGLNAARGLARAKVRVTLVDRQNHHLFQPLLYQVASAALNPSEIAAPIRGVLHGPNTTVLMGEVRAVDPVRKRVLLVDGELHYDVLVLTTGATHSYFGHDEWAGMAPGLKTLDDALEIRRRVLQAFETAEREPDRARQLDLLTFVLVGAGPTGVEMAGALAEIARHSLARDFRNFDPTSARVVLVEGADRVLPGYPQVLSDAARRALERIGVEVRTSARVTDIDPEGVVIGGERLRARTVIWAAGVEASALGRGLGAPVDRAGRVQVTPELTVPGHPDIHIAGDLASLEQDGIAIPGVAPAAIQMGKHVAQNIRRGLRGQAPLPFRYRDKGTFSVIGRGAAVGVLLGRVRMRGVLAWLTWLFVHLMYIVGFRNRLVVLVNWAYSYVAFRRAARLITSGPRALPLPAAPAPLPPGSDGPGSRAGPGGQKAPAWSEKDAPAQPAPEPHRG